MTIIYLFSARNLNVRMQNYAICKTAALLYVVAQQAPTNKEPCETISIRIVIAYLQSGMVYYAIPYDSFACESIVHIAYVQCRLSLKGQESGLACCLRDCCWVASSFRS